MVLVATWDVAAPAAASAMATAAAALQTAAAPPAHALQMLWALQKGTAPNLPGEHGVEV